MNQLTPSQPFTFVYQLGDPIDTNTYYVQSVVRNSSTGAIISTMNLTSQGNQRFAGTFTPPADISGLGYYLDITTTVYTDSGYSNKNTEYEIEVISFLVRQRDNGQNSGGDDGIDEATLIKILQKFFGGTKFKMPKFPVAAPTNFSPLTDRMDMLLENSIQNMRHHLTTHEKVDYLHQSVRDIPEYTPEKVDLSEVLQGMRQIIIAHDTFKRDMLQRHSDHEYRVKKMIDSMSKSIGEEYSKKLDEGFKKVRGEAFHIHALPARRIETKQVDPRMRKLIFPHA